MFFLEAFLGDLVMQNILLFVFAERTHQQSASSFGRRDGPLVDSQGRYILKNQS